MSQKDITNLELVVDVYDVDRDQCSSPIIGLDSKTELEPIVDRDINAFADFYAKTLKNGKLSPFERAVIKTYLYWKTHPEKK